MEIPGVRYTPLALDLDESMSAMVMDENLYQYALTHCDVRYGFNCLNPEALMVFKIAAYLNLMNEFVESGDPRRRNDAHKHRNDVFRVLEHILPTVRAELPMEIVPRVRDFIARFSPQGANYLEWESISQAISSPYLATDPSPMLEALSRLFVL